MSTDRRSAIVGPRLDGAATDDDRPTAVLVELNLRFPGSHNDVTVEFFRTWTAFRGLPAPTGTPAPREAPAGLEYVTGRIYQAVLTRAEVAALIAFDRDPARGRTHTIFKAWPDYVLEAHIDRSAATVQSDAARRAFHATGRGIVWAVVDSGIDATHPHFGALGIADDARRLAAPATVGDASTQSDQAPPSASFGLHRDFTHLVKVGPDPEGGSATDATAVPNSPLTDEDGHGTHVAGIISGRCPRGLAPHVATGDEPVGHAGFVSRQPSTSLSGMARDCDLVSLKVLRLSPQGLLVTSSAAVLRALDYLRTEVNTDGDVLRVHGVNLSLGCEWDPAHYAAGRSPLCQAIDDLVGSGVVVVVSAGNGGQTRAANPNDTVALMGSISEPAHADSCIAVGSTHRDAPHAFGVTYTSGKGPTLDGRSKPDVVAPGEWITSAATGRLRDGAGLGALPDGTENPQLTYAPDSGTSMAAPHVSGVIAAFLSVRTEFVGQPEKVKQILCENATDLRRERYAQGSGLVNLMGMLGQS